MEAKLVEKLTNVLESTLAEVISNSQSVAVDRSVRRDDIRDEGDVARSEVDHGMLMRLNNRENLYLKKVKQALKRIEDGTYGECRECGNDISAKRLLARPTAELCITCKEDSEKRERGSIDGHRAKSMGQLMRFN